MPIMLYFLCKLYILMSEQNIYGILIFLPWVLAYIMWWKFYLSVFIPLIEWMKAIEESRDLSVQFVRADNSGNEMKFGTMATYKRPINKPKLFIHFRAGSSKSANNKHN